jgi:hypothetical protein
MFFQVLPFSGIWISRDFQPLTKYKCLGTFAETEQLNTGVSRTGLSHITIHQALNRANNCSFSYGS